jgi:hypothetical protein
MERVRIAPTYDSRWLEIQRPQPLCDRYLESLFEDTVTGFKGKKPDHSIKIHDEFKTKFKNFVFSSKLNNIIGIDSFHYEDLISGCTQYIDNLYMQGSLQVISGDYKYHERLDRAVIKKVGDLVPEIPLIISVPFPQYADIHPDMNSILDECKLKNIPIHIDGAWITCCKDIVFDLQHETIKSLGISLSKGLGMGWNRIGLRFSKNKISDSISIMNDFHMQNRMLSIVANYVLDNVESDYLWNNYKYQNEKICKDFNLIQTKSIHIAINDQQQPVGLSPLIRYLKNE